MTEGATGEDGTCSFDAAVPVGCVELSHPGYRTRVVPDPGAAAPASSGAVEVRLSPRPLLRVRVVDAEGTVVAAPKFVRCRFGWDVEPIEPEREEIDGAVVFRIPGSEEGESLQVRTEGYGYARVREDVPFGVESVELPRVCVATGRLVGLKRPDHAVLQLFADSARPDHALGNWIVRPEEDGSFRLEGLSRPTGYTVSVVSPEVASESAFRLNVWPESERIDRIRVRARTWADHETVAGRVSDDAGRGIAAVRVSSAGRDSDAIRFSDSAGRFELPMSSSRRTLRFERAGFATVEATVHPGAPLDVVLPQGTLLRGTITDAAGEPVPFSRVSLFPFLEESRDSLEPTIFWAGSDGRFEARRPGVDRHALVAECEGFVPARAVIVEADQESVSVTLERSAWLIVDLEIESELEGPWTVDCPFLVQRTIDVPRNERTVWLEVRPGVVRATVTAPGFRPTGVATEIAPGKSRRVVVRPTR